jgi:hypothetical protein
VPTHKPGRPGSCTGPWTASGRSSKPCVKDSAMRGHCHPHACVTRACLWNYSEDAPRLLARRSHKQEVHHARRQHVAVRGSLSVVSADRDDVAVDSGSHAHTASVRWMRIALLLEGNEGASGRNRPAVLLGALSATALGAVPQGRTARASDTPLGTGGYSFTRSPDPADLSMAAMSSWRRTASAKSGTVWVPLSMSSANAA